ncbi:peptide deformylase [Flavobacterium sp. Sd200]|uniref:peptide deformylase n=1 Tax=Flavobacterium sp. Sd200 TaxID=2692211 RepID=UPI0013715B38|nr:peptide deformylase [Flavobacterium sp. Sd200]MXN90328.1 peptide deformylase [Flavobacterium sp. Sd200]
MKKVLFVTLAFIATANFYAQKMNETEKALITSGDKKTPLRVLQVTDPSDLKVLQTVSTNIDIKDELLPQLTQRMLATVKDPANPGVGIAAPQIGINRNVIWVQRFDKPGEPFEVYLNPKITWRSSLLRKGTEGCLSIPEIRGDVMRNYTIKITYFSPDGKFHDEIVEGFTAVIFQHEHDHLIGILFTDRLSQQEKVPYSPINDEVNLFLERKLKRQ